MAVTSQQMLVVTQVAPYVDGPAGVHGVLEQARVALVQLATMAGLRPRMVGDVADLPADDLLRPGVLALFTIGETPFSPAQRQAIDTAWHAGRLRILGIHSATDACYGWDGYGALLGARFDGHPWTQAFEIEVVDAGHPSTAHLGSTWSWRDEIYVFSGLHPDAHVLLRLPAGQVDLSVPGSREPDGGFPLAWCHGDGPGRTFYTALGHFPAAWEDPAYLRHLSGGLAWLLDGETAAGR